MYTGDVAPETEKGLLTVAWGKDGKVKYSMGASILIAGQVIQWLRDKINLVDHAAKTSVMAESIPDNGGVFSYLHLPDLVHHTGIQVPEE